MSDTEGYDAEVTAVLDLFEEALKGALERRQIGGYIRFENEPGTVFLVRNVKEDLTVHVDVYW